MQQQHQTLNFQVLEMNINSYIKAILFDFDIIDENKITQILQKRNIKLVITTLKQVELQFIQQPIIFVNGIDDHQTIIQYNSQINLVQGNILYLFHEYKLMIKYIISLQLTKNNASDIHNLDIQTQQLIKETKLVNYFNEHTKKLISSSNSTGPGISNIEIINNLPPPIKIPVFQIKKFQ
ncbi:unnamed protein product [Paramecium pentaurelia]|uniref:Uncharacterized protein n=1 Tax=Paramecium pentaurelia TaxID=43138 RepID=A0A8S1V8I2_9CILI|nr:unnamed protein product [Paramecium pentaurelia]